MTSQEANSIPLGDILSHYGYEPSRRYGGYDMYRSPFRSDTSPSFKVFREENRWYDFGDGTYGRAVDLVMRVENCSFPQAMKELGRMRTSRYIINNKYVFHTYAYAIENYQCYAEALHEVCVMATLNDHPLVDFVAFMRMYSQIAYPLFIWSVWFYRKHNLSEFSLLDFCSYVKLDRVSVYHLERSLESMSRRVRRKLLELERRHPKALEEIEAMKGEFAKLGVNEDNTYMFIQGHHIMDSVVMRLLVPVCNVLRRERETEIKELAEHNMQFHNELTSYQRRQLGVDIVLRKHTSYKLSPLYKKLEADIERFLKHI